MGGRRWPLRLGLLALGALAAFAAAVHWNDRAVIAWCDSLQPGTAHRDALASARAAGLHTPWTQSDGEQRLIAFNHRRELLRYACEARFADGLLLDKRHFSAR